MRRVLAAVCSLLLVGSLAACGSGGKVPSSSQAPALSAPAETKSSGQTEFGMRIAVITEDGGKIGFTLNDSTAAKELYNQLPLTVEVEDYSRNEKIFYPSKALPTSDAPLAQGLVGTLAYYAPWGNVAVFYGECGGADGLYELGEAVSDVKSISQLTGEIRIEAVGVSGSSPESVESDEASTKAPSSGEEPTTPESTNGVSARENTARNINVQIKDRIFTVSLEENAVADSLLERMKHAPVVIHMRDYAGFEKVGTLDTELPASDRPATTQPGEPCRSDYAVLWLQFLER